MTFNECLMFCADQSAFIKEFNRLTGFKIGEKRSPIDVMIDKSTGFEEAGLKAFIEFVYEFVWLRLPRDEVKNA